MNQISFFDGSERLKIRKPIRLIELFAGIGAQAKALENLGVPFEHYRICEFDKYAVKSYNAVHGTDFQTSDITQIHADDLAVTETDKFCYIMTYSFPCTDLSSADKQQGMSRESGTRSGLLWQVERLLKEMNERPQILLMENVPEVVSDKNMKDFAEWIAFLDSLGYRSKHTILNAKDFGIPQNRERCFMVSWLGDYFFDFPPTHTHTQREPPRLRDVLEKRPDQKFYLSGRAVSKLKLNDYGYSQIVQVGREREPGRPSGPRCADEQAAGRENNRDCHYADGAGLQRVRQSAYDGGSGMGIIVAASLNPEKAVQDRVRVLSANGICQGLRATDYKDPPKILCADGIYLSVTEKFQRGQLKDLSRALKATSHDAGVVIVYE